jgi:hypothetical protein
MTASDAEADRAAIIATVRDYFEGWFEGDATRMERALHPELAKRSVPDEPSAEGAEGAGGTESLDTVTTAEMIDAAARGIGKQRAAAAHEYLHLVRTAVGWRIANALWQFTSPVGASR